MFVASDVPAILERTRRVIFLEDGDLARVSRDGVEIFSESGAMVQRQETTVTWNLVSAQKGGYAHFMLKEISEQPRAVNDTLRSRISLRDGEVFVEGIPERISRIYLVACGTSWHAALVGKFMIEELARIPVEVDYGSEFRYRDPLLGEESLLILVSQSGETADTLAALEPAGLKGAPTLAICNVVDSSLARKSDAVLYTHAGPEIGVASTKTFVAELAAILLFAIGLGRKRGILSASAARSLLQELVRVGGQMEEVLAKEKEVQSVARRFSRSKNCLYLGRGINYPIALEGALKLKEISYIHAEGYPAGEMKHGPIALIDETMPVVMLMPKDRSYEKTLSNLKEVETRGGRLIVVTDHASEALAKASTRVISVPSCHHLLMPFLLVLPLQLLAYHVAVLLGTDVDQPRNLAKSVTVE
jgi:glucosamine--fructose-6-phosphate aminotransferase (isomerizing)